MEKSNKINIKEKIEQGWVKARILFEMAGSPKEHVVKTLNDYIAVLKKNSGIIVLSEENPEPIFHKQDNIWSTFNELELLVEGLEKFVYIAFSFTPASIEILEPRELTLTQKNVTDWLNEILALLHQVGVTVKNQNVDKEILQKQVNALARNCIRLSLEEPKKEKDISKDTGIDLKTTQQLLEAMIKEKRIIKNKDVYELA